MKRIALAMSVVVFGLGCAMEMEPVQEAETATEEQAVSPAGRKQLKCGHDICAVGEFCCNESCGICAPIGSVCTQQICGKWHLK